jgi:hypothetical protein
LARDDALAAGQIKRCRGILVKHRREGDSLFAVFARAVDAVAAASAPQRALCAKLWRAETSESSSFDGDAAVARAALGEEG